jgi:hypothetical protein
MAEPSTPTGSAAEAWLREALHRLLIELMLFSRTFIAFVHNPGRSAREWQAGDRIFMNPLGFAAAAAGVYWAVTSVLAALWPIPGPDMTDTLGKQLTSAAGPYVHYGLLGMAMHFGLRLLGSRRRILGSIGVAFFAGGSIGTLAALVVTASARWFGHARGTHELALGSQDPVPWILFSAAVVSYALIWLAMARALMALHRTAAWKVVIAGAFAVVVTAFLFGSVLPDGAYGWRPYIGVDLDGGFGFSFGFRG